MSEPDFTLADLSLEKARVAILGLGLMGGSLALGLRGKVGLLLGCDPDPEVVEHARQGEIFDRVGQEAAEILPQANLIILAAPVGGILATLAHIPDLHPGEAYVFDIGSTKSAIVHAMAALPPRLPSVGGHPMCGKEKGGLDQADPDMFLGARYVLTATSGTTPHGRALAEELVRALGAWPLWLEAADHDRLVARTSHVVYLLSVALARATPLEAAELIGPGFRSSARLAGSSPTMMKDVLRTNREAVREALEALQAELNELDTLLDMENAAELEEHLWMAKSDYQHLLGFTAGD